MTLPDKEEELLRTKLAQEFFLDPIAFFRKALGHWFPKPMPWVHRGMVAIRLRRADFLLNFGEELWADGSSRWTKKDLAKLVRCFKAPLNPADPDSPLEPIFKVRYKEDNRTPCGIDLKISQHVVIVMPRGFSKTTLMNACEIFDIVNNNTKFDLYISDTGPQAQLQIEAISREFETNDIIRYVYGNLVPSRSQTETWASEEIETLSGVTLTCRGSGAQIRGINKLGERPKRITLDDIENLENTNTDDQRLKVKKWYFSDVEPALPRIKSQGHILIIGSVIHSDSWILSMTKDIRFTVIKFGAIDPEGEALWDEYMSLEKIELEKARYAKMGQLSTFYMEFLSQVRNDETAKFNSSMIKIQPRNLDDVVERVMAVDPAISEKSSADFFAIAVGGMTQNGIIHLFKVWMKRGVSPREQVNRIFELKNEFKVRRVGIEGIAYQAALIHLVKEEMWRMSKIYGSSAYFEPEKLPISKTRKVERVEGIIVPRYSAGYITHQESWPDYEGQLLDWPEGKKDGPDVVSMVVSMLDPYAAFAIDDPERIMKDEFEPLDYAGGAP